MTFRLCEQLRDPFRSHPHIDMHERRTAMIKKRYARFSRHGFGDERLSDTRGSHQQYPFGQTDIERTVLLRMFEKIDDLFELDLDLFDPRHVFEGDVRVHRKDATALLLRESYRAFVTQSLGLLRGVQITNEVKDRRAEQQQRNEIPPIDRTGCHFYGIFTEKGFFVDGVFIDLVTLFGCDDTNIVAVEDKFAYLTRLIERIGLFMRQQFATVP